MLYQFLGDDRFKFANTTHEWLYTDNLETYQKVKDKVCFAPREFTYKFNNRGFRCDDFEAWEKHPIRIVFAGCSETEGAGLPLENVWAKIFHSKVCSELGHQIPFWSVAHGGASMDHVVKQLYNEADSLRPQIVIALLPHFERRERWNNDYWGPWAQERESSKILLNEDYVLYQTEKNLCFLNLLMEKWDSLFLYAKNYQSFDLSNLNFDRFVKVDHKMDYIDLGRDAMHGGPKTNEEFANKMFESLWPLIAKKLNIQ